MPGIPYPTTTNTIQAVNYEPGTAGNDRILTANVSNTFINGGNGDDYITLINWNITTDASAGNDVIEIFNISNVTGGAGNDYFVFDGTKWNGAAYEYVSTSTWSITPNLSTVIRDIVITYELVDILFPFGFLL